MAEIPDDITKAIDRACKFAGMCGQAQPADQVVFGRLYNEARAALDAAIAARLSEWRPIEGAPKDRRGVALIAPYPTQGWSDARIGWWDGDAWARWPHSFPPTHWTPLPPPPASQGEGGEG